MRIKYSKKSKTFTFFKGLTKNKGLEMNAYAWGPSANLNFSVGFSTKEDHAGFRFRVDIFGFAFEIVIYDYRHWNYEADRWYEEGEEEAELKGV
jgi:hypothetical protein